MHFAVTYWRSASGPVMNGVLKAQQAGLPICDLRLIVLNTDLRFRQNKLFVRRSFLARVFSAGMAMIVGVSWLLMYAIAVTAPSPPLLKVVVILGIFSVYAVLYRGWSLYAYRALVAVDRCGTQLEEICSVLNQEIGKNLSPILQK
jgi:xanthosine utilization system XapX-like protein